jgi:hypothetical protein
LYPPILLKSFLVRAAADEASIWPIALLELLVP